jgi:hypothetical protein
VQQSHTSRFWKNYKHDLIVEKNSDHGPYGGHSAIYWNAGNSTAFSAADILGFASKNGWTLVDSAAITKDQVNKWMYSNQAVFPLTKTGFSDSVLNNAQLRQFPRWFGGPVNLYTFKTGWITIEPGTDNSIEENGFVLLNDDWKEMAVYFLWGE